MMSYCRSALGALILAAGACGVSTTAVSAQFSAHNWAFVRYETSLTDGSVLTEYAGQTVNLKNPASSMRVGFIPRFGCAPLISLFSVIPSGSKSNGSVDGFAVSEFSIDGTPMRYSSLVEVVDSRVVVYYSGNLAKRITLRLHIDEGDRSSAKLSNGQALSFSLLGSRAVLEHAENHCKQHLPK